MTPNCDDAYQFFHEGTRALAEMEHYGIKIDTKYLHRVTTETQAEIRKKNAELTETKVYRLWVGRFGQQTNLNSVEQLGTVLFDIMKYKGGTKTASGKHQVDQKVLEKIDDPFIVRYLEVKKLKKTVSTYFMGILRETCNDFLHPSYNLAGGMDDEQKGGALSYRGSSSNINFQNIPIRNPVTASLIRPAFIARKGNHLCEIDFSQLEVRIGACYNKDPALIRYIQDKSTCMHRDTAQKLFFLKKEEVGKKTTRDCAKNQFVFPEFYGSYYTDCAANIWDSILRRKFKVEGSEETILERLRKNGITKLGACSKERDVKPKKGTFEYHCKDVEDDLWNNRFKVTTEWRKQFFSEYLKKGYFDMHTGFRCEGVFRRNQVINFPVQGAAFHCLLWCIIRIQKECKRMKAKLVGQIHDCLLADVPPRELQAFLNIVERVMTVDILKHWKWITVPLEIEIDVCEIGKTWNDKKQYTRNKSDVWTLAS